ncbi:MAG TPA: GNAT family N-acetyltransferase [Candidatus Saccharimonadia bacterium]|nr:GNAT family N-acetyltransferase [Candidatus Saccharimonadia bacterium]
MSSFREGIPSVDFDQRQELLGAHFLQSGAWAQFLAAQGETVVWDEGDGWSWVGAVRSGRGVRYVYAPYGPTVRDGTALALALASLKAAAKALGADFARVEPVGGIEARDLPVVLKLTASVQPQHSWALDLTLSEEELRAGLIPSHRNVINGAERRGLSFRLGEAPEDLEQFLAFLHETKRLRGFEGFGDDYYRTMMATLAPLGCARLFVAEAEGRAVAASIVFDGYGVRYYAHTGLSEAARKLRATAPLVWTLAMDARERGLRRFDLWGVAPPGAPKTHPWAGFTEFKQSFGGEPVDYVGTWELPVAAAKYRLYRWVRRVAR